MLLHPVKITRTKNLTLLIREDGYLKAPMGSPKRMEAFVCSAIENRLHAICIMNNPRVSLRENFINMRLNIASSV